MKTRVVMFVIGSLIGLAAPAIAQDNGWYVGAGAGTLHSKYVPYYTFYMGGTPDQFENKADGLHLELLAGRRLRQLNDTWLISLQGTVAFNSFQWELAIPEEPSELEYSQPWRLALSVVPEARLGRVSLFGDIGSGAGRVHEVKTTTDGRVSRYDYDKIRPTLTFGGGVKMKASTGVDVFARVGHARYFGVEYDTFNEAGVVPGPAAMIEHVTDKPRATGFTVGIIKRF